MLFFIINLVNSTFLLQIELNNHSPNESKYNEFLRVKWEVHCKAGCIHSCHGGCTGRKTNTLHTIIMPL